MPTIREFDGYRIYMYFEDHGRPHFHIVGRDFEAKIAIDDLSVIAGDVPRRARPALDWARENKQLLMDRWNAYSELR